MKISEFIKTELEPSALEMLRSVYSLGEAGCKEIAPNIKYDEFESFATGYLGGIRYVLLLVQQYEQSQLLEQGNFEWTKGDFIQKQGEV